MIESAYAPMPYPGVPTPATRRRPQPALLQCRTRRASSADRSRRPHPDGVSHVRPPRPTGVIHVRPPRPTGTIHVRPPRPAGTIHVRPTGAIRISRTRPAGEPARSASFGSDPRRLLQPLAKLSSLWLGARRTPHATSTPVGPELDR